MAEDILEGRLKALKGSRARRQFLEGLYEEVCRLEGNFNFPYIAVEALGQLVLDLTKKRERGKTPTAKKTTVVLNTIHSFRSQPVFDTHHNRFVYFAHFLGNQHRLYNDSSGNPDPSPLEAVAQVEGRTTRYTFLTPEGLQQKIFETDMYEPVRRMPSSVFASSVGVATRKANANGSINFRNELYAFGTSHKGKDVLVFYAPGDKCYFFDLWGEMLFERLSNEEVIQQRKIQKMLAIQDEMEDLDSLDSSSELLYAQLKEEWSKDPQEFATHYGRTYVITGEVQGTMNELGEVGFAHFRDQHFLSRVHGAREHAGKEAKLVIQGPYMTVHHEGEMINAHRLGGIIYYTKTMRRVNNAHLVNIRTVGNTKQLKRDISGSLYHFSMRAFKKEYSGDLKEAQAVGIIVDTQREKYEALIIEKDGAFVSVPLQLHAVY